MGDRLGPSQIGVRLLSMHAYPSPRGLDRKRGSYIIEINDREIVALEATWLAEARHLITELCLPINYRAYDQWDTRRRFSGDPTLSQPLVELEKLNGTKRVASR